MGALASLWVACFKPAEEAFETPDMGQIKVWGLQWELL